MYVLVGCWWKVLVMHKVNIWLTVIGETNMIRPLIFFLGFLVLVSCSRVTAATEAPQADLGDREYRIFMVNSYNPEYFWSARQSQGIKDGLAGFRLVTQEYFMDSKRHPEAEWLARQKEICLVEITVFKPDLIFTGDDNATRLIATHFLGQSLPVVFYGLNAEPESYGLVTGGQRQAPGGNITGVLERHDFMQAISKLNTLCHVNNQPISKLYLLTDNSYTSNQLFESLRQAEMAFQFKVICLPPVGDVAEYQSLVDELNHPGNALFIYNLQTIKGSHGNYVDYRVILAWTRARLKIPSITFHRKYVEEGLMFGLLVSGYNQAFHAALKAKKILLGTPPGEIAIEIPPQGTAALNKTTIQRLGFKVPLDLLFGAEIFE